MADERASGLQREIEQLKAKMSGGMNEMGSRTADTDSKIFNLSQTVEEMQEKLWELDKSWKNNLVFYGLKMDHGTEEHPSITENKVREIIHRKLQLTRDIPILRVKRVYNGPQVRGSKPVTVYFEKWQDKDEILRKTKLLRGSNIYIGEDFSKRVRDQRQELQKYMRSVRKKRPDATCSLQYDKLMVDNEIYMYNDPTGQVELVKHGGDSEENGTSVHPLSAPSETIRLRQKSTGSRSKALMTTSMTSSTPMPSSGQKLQKSYSTESSLNHIVPNTPIHPKQEPKKSPSPPGKEEAKEESRIKENQEMNHNDPKDPPDSPVKRAPEEEEDDDLDYNSINNYNGSMRKLNPDIPETIPE